MAGDDLFAWIDGLYTKKALEGTPPMFMIHRFVASDRRLANPARILQKDLRQEPDLLYRTWQGLLPTGKSAPRFGYVAAKKPAAAELVITKIMQTMGENRRTAEQMYELYVLAGHETELYRFFGIDPKTKTGPAGKLKEKPKPKGGLLG